MMEIWHFCLFHICYIIAHTDLMFLFQWHFSRRLSHMHVMIYSPSHCTLLHFVCTSIDTPTFPLFFVIFEESFEFSSSALCCSKNEEMGDILKRGQPSRIIYSSRIQHQEKDSSDVISPWISSHQKTGLDNFHQSDACQRPTLVKLLFITLWLTFMTPDLLYCLAYSMSIKILNRIPWPGTVWERSARSKWHWHCFCNGYKKYS